MIKKIILSLSIISAGVFSEIKSQTIPTYPSVDDALAKAKSSDFLRGLLKLDYNADVTKCTFSKKYYSNTEEKEVDAYFGKYTSDRCAELFPISMPYDRCITYITVTTSKDANGTVYQVPVGVKYSRLKNDVLTNQWEYYNVELGSPRVIGGVANDSKAKIALLVGGIKKFPLKNGQLYGGDDETGFNGSVEALKHFSRIDSIYCKGEKIDNAKEQTWFFEIKGQEYNSNTGDIIDDATLTDNYIVNVALQVKLENAKWNIVDLMIRDNHGNDRSNTKYNGPLLACFGQVNFDKIYKNTAFYQFAPDTEGALKLKAKQLQKAIENLSYNEEKDLKLLVQFFDPENNPEKMALDLFKILKEAKDKQCTIHEINVYGSYYGKPGSGSTDNFIKINAEFKRESCLTKPELKEQYKAAGMNAKLMKQTGGDLYSRALFQNNSIKLVIRENTLFLVSAPTLSELISF